MLLHGRKTVAVAGADEPLVGSSARCQSVTITALATNTAVVCIGGSGVDATLATRTGTPLAAGDSLTIASNIDGENDLAHVFVDALVNGEGVSYSYVYSG